MTLGSTSKPKLRQWFSDMGDDLTEVDIEGRRALMLTEHLDVLADIPPSRGVRLLSGFDQYILGPGTNDEALLPKPHRAAVSRTSGWISPIVLVDGRVAGVWDVLGNDAVVSPFPDSDPLLLRDLEQEAEHLARASGHEQLAVRVV